jgi:transcriptional regulator GlxA family with amidase domain
MGLFSHFFKRPRPNQVFDEDGRVVTKHEGEAWMDLFIDLVRE